MKKIEVNRKDLKNNINIIKKIAYTRGKDDNGENLKIIGVVKGNGMGLDIIKYSKFLINNGIEILAVSTVEEAMILRKAKISNEIILLSPTNIKEELESLIKNDITIAIDNLEQISIINSICKKENLKVKAHLKIDTGFGRYGFLYTDIENILKVFENLKYIEINGTFTHFSKAMDDKWTNIQFNRFMKIVEQIKQNNYNPGMLHACASTAFLKYKIMHLNAVRIGSAFQGRTLIKCQGLKKIGNFVTSITEIKTLPKGYNIGYSNTYKTKKETKIALIPVGYNDGLNKNKLRDNFTLKENILSVCIELKKIFKDNNIKATINGKKYNILGRIGMCYSVIDITGNDEIKVGDKVYLDISPLQTNEAIRREYI